MTILIGYVPTPLGETALEHGLEEAAARGDDVVVLNSPRRGSTVDAQLIDEETCARILDQARAAGVTARIEQAEHGSDLVTTFSSVAKQTGARLAVIGIRRRSPVGKLVMGSSAQQLLLELDIPVLAVKPAR